KDILQGLPGEFTVVQCCTCSLMRTNPRPTPESIGFYYPDDYGPYLGTQVHEVVQKQVSLARRVLRSFSKRIIHYNTSTLPAIPQGRMLEIGCASGSFMHQMAEQGWQVEGIEFSEKAALEASQLGYKVYAGQLEEAPLPSKQVDLIVGWMVIEHLHDPVGGLKKLRQCSKPDGWIALSVPNAASFEFKLFNDKWYALQLPTHLYHYTPQSIEKMLEASGWSLIKIHHQRVLGNFFASTGYVLKSKGLKKLGEKLIDFPENSGRWNQLLYPLAWLLSLFGQTGRMTVWARCDS
ncbi:MAG: class I SAM-dependent methyltransferase, partial [Pseudomonadales bacterium]|nr:class I SAM-dependent methyltransferase [Pseudomonadales bacterium]